MAAVRVGAPVIGTDPCGNTVSFAQPFLSWGDSATYVALPGGSFEPAAPKFTLTGGAAVVSGNEPFQVNDAGDTHSLALPAGSTATSPGMCIGVFYPTMRGFAVNTGSPWSTLRVDVVYGKNSGMQNTITLGSFAGSGAWQPTSILGYKASSLGSTGNGQIVNFKFTVVGAGSWKIDDFYVDPTKHG
jgi:hypothetical protein